MTFTLVNRIFPFIQTPRVVSFVSILTFLVLLPPAVLSQSSQNNSSTSSIELEESEIKRKELNAKFDIRNIRRIKEFHVDHSEEFLQYPNPEIDREFDEFEIAKVAPAVKFQILPNLEPEYFSEEAYQAGWANWAKLARSDDNRFYLAASDHLGRGAQINIYEYRPDENVVERVLDVSDALDWSRDMYTDGKIHGEMGIMPDGTLWAATHRGPLPTEEWYESGYRGSWLLSYNINTGESKNRGVPLIGNELPNHTLDTKRGIFLATGGLTETMLSYDVNNNKTRFAGYPPNGWRWFPRTIFLDPETGIFWGMEASEKPYRFMSFDPERNRFKRYDVEIPPNPFTKTQHILRTITKRPAMDGWFYGATRNGAFFRFRPDWENGPEVEIIGTTWSNGRDVLQMAIDPSGRYIYYQPREVTYAQGSQIQYGDEDDISPSPLVQYDVKTGKKKVIAYLQDYYFEKYGYWLGSSVFGVEVSNDGSFVVMVENGTFEGRGKDYGHPAITIVEIPAEERIID